MAHKTRISMREEDTVLQTYDEVLAKALELFTNDVNALEIAASFVNVGLSFYRTVLDEEDYNIMVNTISDRRDEIAEYKRNDLEDLNMPRVLH